MVGIAGLLGSLVEPIFSVIDKAVLDKDKAAELKTQIQSQVLNSKSEAMKAASAIIVAEAQGESWLQRNWRPLTMLTFVVIMANNFIVSPMLGSVGLPIPPDMWSLMQIGLGGYIGGRTAEKIAPTVMSMIKK